jgi:hypothetical protein
MVVFSFVMSNLAEGIKDLGGGGLMNDGELDEIAREPTGNTRAVKTKNFF